MSKNTGSLHHNFSGFYSFVLLATCDGNYCFTLFDVGQYGSNNDTDILIHRNIGGHFEDHLNKILQPESVEECDFYPLPYFLVGGRSNIA